MQPNLPIPAMLILLSFALYAYGSIRGARWWQNRLRAVSRRARLPLAMALIVLGPAILLAAFWCLPALFPTAAAAGGWLPIVWLFAAALTFLHLQTIGVMLLLLEVAARNAASNPADRNGSAKRVP